MSFKQHLANSAIVRFLAHNTPFLRGVGRKLVPATDSEEAVEVAERLLANGYHVCLHHLGKISKNLDDIQENTRAVMEAMEVLDEEGLEVCISVIPSEMGYMKSAKVGEGHCRQIAQVFRNRINVRDVEERQGYGEGHGDGDHRNLMMVHASERVAMQRVLGLYSLLARTDIPVCVTVPTGLARSVEDVKTLVSQGAKVRLSLTPLRVIDARTFDDEEIARDQYMQCARILLSEDAVIQQVMPVFAVEDKEMAEQIKMMADFEGWSVNAFEFEIPYGINNALKKKLRDEGYTVRVLVPFGREWWPYFQRRSAI
jgi:proline dehydrogenase